MKFESIRDPVVSGEKMFGNGDRQPHEERQSN